MSYYCIYDYLSTKKNRFDSILSMIQILNTTTHFYFSITLLLWYTYWDQSITPSIDGWWELFCRSNSTLGSWFAVVWSIEAITALAATPNFLPSLPIPSLRSFTLRGSRFAATYIPTSWSYSCICGRMKSKYKGNSFSGNFCLFPSMPFFVFSIWSGPTTCSTLSLSVGWERDRNRCWFKMDCNWNGIIVH